MEVLRASPVVCRGESDCQKVDYTSYIGRWRGFWEGEGWEHICDRDRYEMQCYQNLCWRSEKDKILVNRNLSMSTEDIHLYAVHIPEAVEDSNWDRNHTWSVPVASEPLMCITHPCLWKGCARLIMVQEPNRWTARLEFVRKAHIYPSWCEAKRFFSFPGAEW